MSADPVDMTVPGRIEEARRMALASTPPEKWCQCRSSDLADLSEPTDMLWTVMAADESVCAVTGNGPTSKANANLYFHARAIILGLLDEIDRLRTHLRNANGGHEWARHPREGWTVCGSCGLVRNYENGGKTCAGRLPSISTRDAEGAPASTAPEQVGGPDDTVPRAPGCACHLEEGDSPCPVHPSDDDAPEQTGGAS